MATSFASARTKALQRCFPSQRRGRLTDDWLPCNAQPRWRETAERWIEGNGGGKQGSAVMSGLYRLEEADWLIDSVTLA
jgi:hypothetical protein